MLPFIYLLIYLHLFELIMVTCLKKKKKKRDQLLETMGQWLRWSDMTATIQKCCSLAIRTSSGNPFNPKLTLNNEPITYLGDSTINFLGAPVSILNRKIEIRQSLKKKLESLLQRIDVSLVTRQQKLRLYKLAVCPHLTWELSINSFPITYVERELTATATRYLKKWAGLTKPADPNSLYLPKCKGGLELPSIATMYKKLQIWKATTLMMSKDSAVRHLTSTLTRKEQSKQREAFQPFSKVVEAIKNEPGASKKTIKTRVKNTVQKQDDEFKWEHSKNLQVQGQMLRQFEDNSAATWINAISQLPGHIFKFAENAVKDTLPHNTNLHLWGKLESRECTLCGKEQTLQHVLSTCTYALNMSRYNHRHDAVLKTIYNFLINHLPLQFQSTADLPDQIYSFPIDITPTECRPDIVVLDNKEAMFLIELTVPFETNLEGARERKQAKYADLLKECRQKSYASLITVQVGARGYISRPRKSTQPVSDAWC